MSGKAFDSLPVFMFIIVVAGLLVAFGASVLLPPSQGAAATVGAEDNGKTVSVSEGALIKVSLDENPTTGYSWYVTTTAGLTVVDSQYVPSGSGMMGAGGVHEWTIKAAGKGQQQFSAVYKQPWMPVAGNETTFTLNVSAT